MLCRYLSYPPGEVPWVYRLLDSVAEGCSGRGPAHLLVESAAEIGFQWDSLQVGWEHYRAAVLRPGGVRFRLSYVLGRAFVGALRWVLKVPCSSLTLTMFGRDKVLLRSVLVGGVWSGFLPGKVKGQHVPCRFCGGDDGDGHLFWDCTFTPLVEIREHPEFHGITEMEKSCWPRCLLWHGWLPLLCGVNGGSP